MEGTYEVLPRAETSKGSAMCEIQFFHRPGDSDKKGPANKPDKKREKQLRQGPGVSFRMQKGQETPTAIIGMKKGKAKHPMLVNFGALYATPVPRKEPHVCHKEGGASGGLLGNMKGGKGGQGQGHDCHHGHTHGPLGSVFGVVSGLMRSFVHHEHHSELFSHHRHNFRNGGGAHKHHNFRW